ncbi:MAG: HAD-IA family hydrolase, partial [Clostridia bacterium]|nr:HAD-IA family hydrolase [Clostridia bacterium]
MYEAIVFDLDGTLLDTLEDLEAAVNAALSVCGLPLRTKDEVRRFIGNGIAKLMERAVGERTDCKEAALAEFKRYYAEHCKDKTKPYHGIMELLHTLQEKGVKTAVLSTKADFAVKLLAEEYFPGLLQEAVGENEAQGIRKKPAPDALYTVMENLHTKNIVYVGDSEVDVETAKNAGVDCLCVTWGFRD